MPAPTRPPVAPTTISSGIAAEARTEAIGRERRPDPCTLVIFGATGDLAHRKLMPALYQLARERLLPAGFRIVGFSRGIGPDPDEYRASVRAALQRYSRTQPVDEEVWRALAKRIDVVPGDFGDQAAFARLSDKLRAIEGSAPSDRNRLYYFATAAAAFPTLLRQLAGAGLIHPVGADRPESSEDSAQPWSRVVIEKPFGRDLESARALNRTVAEVLDESQVYRIDHYLGKETVQNILVLRFANAIFEPLWNRKYVDHVQITAAEEIGVEGRVGFYDQTGALRDMVQSHLLQVLALCAMETPVSMGADDIRDAKVQVLRSLRRLDANAVKTDVVRAQYAGYGEQAGVKHGSRTPTYVALKVMIDNWRWQGVPFYLRTGKHLARHTTEVSLHFQPVPMCLFGREDICDVLKPNVLTLRIQPDEGVSLRFESKVPGEELAVGSVTMNMSYTAAFGRASGDAYERLLLDAMRGNATLFARRDAVEILWAFVDPILAAWESDKGVPASYARGSSGPREADELLARDGRCWDALR